MNDSAPVAGDGVETRKQGVASAGQPLAQVADQRLAARQQHVRLACVRPAFQSRLA